jgi:formamidopyrimidine-DNA glycosylase
VPELIEVEVYRQLADRTVGRRIAVVETPDDWFLKGVTAAEVQAALAGAVVGGTDRIGKLLLVDVGDERPTLGLRFGMTGRLVLDGEAPIQRLEYSSHRDDPAWDRFALVFDDGTRLRLSDPRRLGGVELDPPVGRLGPDAASITAAALAGALAGSSAPLKARLLDQHRVAGLGNLLVDETLWRAGIDPTRVAGELPADEVAGLARAIRSTVRTLSRRGGSHTGDLQVARHRGATCPRDGADLLRRTVGGRTTYSCPVHQR